MVVRPDHESMRNRTIDQASGAFPMELPATTQPSGSSGAKAIIQHIQPVSRMNMTRNSVAQWDPHGHCRADLS